MRQQKKTHAPRENCNTEIGLLLIFFFQAEDGIRHHCVTGVQTCALPISPSSSSSSSRRSRPSLAGTRPDRSMVRSEERRVGKECRSRWTPCHKKKKSRTTSGSAASPKASTSCRTADFFRRCRSRVLFFFSSRRRHTRSLCDWSSDVCSSDLGGGEEGYDGSGRTRRW